MNNNYYFDRDFYSITTDKDGIKWFDYWGYIYSNENMVDENDNKYFGVECHERNKLSNILNSEIDVREWIDVFTCIAKTYINEIKTTEEAIDYINEFDGIELDYNKLSMETPDGKYYASLDKSNY